jgi:glycerophosphoryl diester phosphodiesterase
MTVERSNLEATIARRLGGVVLAGILLVVAAMSSASPDVQVAAHRGGALLWPENGLTAFRNALALGADYLELDVHLTADGEVVVIHDPALDRTTTGRGAVSSARLTDLAATRLRARDGSLTEDGVPTLAQVLDTLKPSSAQLLLEIKVDGQRKPYAGIEDKALALVNARGLRDRVIVMAFEAPTLARVRALDAAIRTALLVSRSRVRREGASAADLVRWARDVSATHLGVEHTAVDAALVTAARGAGLKVAAWTANEEADIRRLVDLGVGVVISDRPDLALRLAGRPPRTP